MAKNDMAKSLVVAKLKEIFGNDFLGEADKKYYVMSEENGEKVQVAISLTCPKVPVEFAGMASNSGSKANAESVDFDWGDTNKPAEPQPAVVSNEEQENIRKMLEKLGL